MALSFLSVFQPSSFFHANITLLSPHCPKMIVDLPHSEIGMHIPSDWNAFEPLGECIKTSYMNQHVAAISTLKCGNGDTGQMGSTILVHTV